MQRRISFTAGHQFLPANATVEEKFEVTVDNFPKPKVNSSVIEIAFQKRL